MKDLLQQNKPDTLAKRLTIAMRAYERMGNYSAAAECLIYLSQQLPELVDIVATEHKRDMNGLH